MAAKVVYDKSPTESLDKSDLEHGINRITESNTMANYQGEDSRIKKGLEIYAKYIICHQGDKRLIVAFTSQKNAYDFFLSGAQTLKPIDDTNELFHYGILRYVFKN